MTLYGIIEENGKRTSELLFKSEDSAKRNAETRNKAHKDEHWTVTSWTLYRLEEAK